MGNIINGSADLLSTLEITSDMEGLDAMSKQVLRHKEVLAVIAKGTIEEYKGYSLEEIMSFIEADSISSQEVSRGRTNTVIQGAPTEENDLNEKTTFFDVMFRSRNPKLSHDSVLVNLHVDIESQKDYRPGYPIEKRGIYYLARSMSSQLNLLTEQTDYSHLEKCYSIWICRDRIPKSERFPMSFYRITNTQNVGNCRPKEEDYDLMTLVVIRLGEKIYEKDENDLLHFLTLLFYPHRSDFIKQMGKYIDFSQNLKLLEGVKRMRGLGQSILEEGIEEGIEKGIEKGADRINRLNQRLKEDGRRDDIMKAIDDKDYQRQLLEEYGI